MAPVGDPEERSALEDAKRFLYDLLANGPVSSKEVAANAKEAGHASPTIKRAKHALGAEAYREGYGKDGAWWLRLPSKGIKNIKGEQHKTLVPFDNVDPLCGTDGSAKAIKEGATTDIVEVEI